MIVTSELISKIKKSYLNYSNNVELIKENREIKSNHEAKMFEVITQVIKFYKKNPEKSKFLEKCILNNKSWEQVYEDFYIEKRTYFAWKEEIVYDTVICAAIDGLITLETINQIDQE